MMRDLPEGVVTFLFTDIQGSTRLFEKAPDAMLEALRQHDEAIEEAVGAHGGIPVRPRGEGDSRFIVFANAYDGQDLAFGGRDAAWHHPGGSLGRYAVALLKWPL